MARVKLTEFHTLHAASDAAGSLKHSDICEALLQKRFGSSQASQASTNHHHTRLSPSPQATTERVIRTFATGFTTLHTVRTHLLGTCRRGVSGLTCSTVPRDSSQALGRGGGRAGKPPTSSLRT